MSEVPPGWQAMKLKTLARLVTVKASDSIVKIGLEDLESWTGRLTPSGSVFEGEGVAFEPGDVLFGKLRPYLAKAWVADRRGAAVGDFLVMRPSKGVDGRFLRSVLLTPERVTEISAAAYGAKMPRASWEAVRDLDLVFPAGSLQQQVVEYLDRETAEIDAFIAEQEQLIALLLERHAATTSHAVTSGLDPTVPMKDSGVEWLGMVPAHWSVTRVSRFFSVVLGKMLDVGKTPSPDATVLPYVRAANIQETGLDLNSVNEMPFSPAEARILDIRRGDLLVVEGGAVGLNTHIDADMAGWSFQKTVNRVRAISDGSTRFLGFSLDALRRNGVIDMLSNKSTIAHLTAEKLERVVIAFPPASEQIAIAEHLQGAAKEIDAAIADAREAIALSRERRAALISAAVTGKIDVRGAA